MRNPFKRIRTQCTFCGTTWSVPLRRVHRLERLCGVEPGGPLVWECHDCHEGVVVPAAYTNIHGEKVVLDPTKLPRNTRIARF